MIKSRTSPHFSMGWLILFSLWLLFPLGSQAWCSNRFERIGGEQGLSQTVINTILQDKRGYLWFGTQDGLNRYDGYGFKVYRSHPQESLGISDNHVNGILEDEHGFLWIATSLGLNRFDPRDESFVSFLHTPGDAASLSQDLVQVLFIDRSENLWVGTRSGGLNRYEPSTGGFRRFKHVPQDPCSISDDRIRTIFEDSYGFLWIGTEHGLNRFDPSQECFEPFFYDADDPRSLSHNVVSAVTEDRNGLLWVGTQGGGLNWYDRVNMSFTRLKHDPDDPASLGDNRVLAILADSKGTVWVGTEKGLNRYGGDSRDFIRYRHSDFPGSLSDDHVCSLYEDRGGILWIGTWGGISKYNREVEYFGYIHHDPHEAGSLSHNTIWSIFKDRQGRLWIGTGGGGLNRIDRSGKKAVVYRHDPRDSQSLSDDDVRVIHQDGNGNLWIGTRNGGLNRFDDRSQTFENFKHDSAKATSLSHNNIRTLLDAPEGKLWVGTYGGGLDLFNPREGSFQHFLFNDGDQGRYSPNEVRCLMAGEREDLWIGTNAGLTHFDPRVGTWERFVHSPSKPKSLSHNVVLCLFKDSQGQLWAGTLNGLNRFSPKSGDFRQYREGDGLANAVVYGILSDRQGFLWVSNNKGIDKFNPTTGEFKNYNIHHGLQNNEFNAGAFFKSQSGEMFFGGVNGVNAFFPEQIVDDPHGPPVVISDLRLNHRPVPLRSENEKTFAGPAEKGGLTATSHHGGVISFEFAALHFAAPACNSYAYKLEGFDRDWTFTDADKRYATYTNLDPGRYKFRVKAANYHGVWNERGTAIAVVIEPPFWLSSQSYILYLLLVLGLGFSFFVWKHKKEQENERLRLLIASEKDAVEANKAKTEFLSNMSHELRTPLNSIIGYCEMYLERREQISDKKLVADLIKMYHASLYQLTLVENILDLTKIVAGKVDFQLEKINVALFLEEVVHSVKGLMEQSHNRLVVDCDPNVGFMKTDGFKLKQCLLNLLKNAGQFTQDGQVTLKVRRAFLKGQGMIFFEVADTGIGMSAECIGQVFERFSQGRTTTKKNGQGMGLGLAITRGFCELMGGRITVESNLGQGSRFTLRLPQDA